ncbi:MAG TPA: META domain-containing protein [Candidatus Polarisedimenticolaceae bacterium]|nr:META domain-containing protein [Candidatus Polarisedimenticolaceae bacterium]
MFQLRGILAIGSLAGLAAGLGCGGPGQQAEPPSQPAPSSASAGRPAELADTAWVLQSYGPSGEERFPVEGTRPTLSLESAGRAVGMTGCNHFTTTWSADEADSSFELRAMTMTRMGCPEEVMDQEYALVNAYSSVESYETTGEELTLYYRGGDALLLFFRDTEAGVEAEGEAGEVTGRVPTSGAGTCGTPC